MVNLKGVDLIENSSRIIEVKNYETRSARKLIT